MKVETEGILISKQKFGETSCICSIFTKNEGLIKGLVKGAFIKKDKSLIELGNILDVTWSARLSNQLGYFNLSLKESTFKTVIDSSLKISALRSICCLLHNLLPEWQKEEDLYKSTINLIHLLQLNDFFTYYSKWELLLLKSLGYGLDLSKCILCNQATELFYVSPNTGAAVCKQHGNPWKHKLLTLPKYLGTTVLNDDYVMDDITSENVINNNNALATNNLNNSNDSKINGLKLSGHFLTKVHNLQNKKMPPPRDLFFRLALEL